MIKLNIITGMLLLLLGSLNIIAMEPPKNINNDMKWKTAANYLIVNSNEDDTAAFKIVKQIFLNIDEAGIASEVARNIATKWKDKTDRKSLMDLIRYPNMKDNDIKEAGQNLFKNHKDFINTTLGMDCNIP